MIVFAVSPLVAMLVGGLTIVLISIAANGGALLISFCLGCAETVYPDAEALGEIMVVLGALSGLSAGVACIIIGMDK
jgi:hypothetical protein